MPKQVHIKTIAIPRGFRPTGSGATGTLLLSVLIVPQLTPDQNSKTLSAYNAMSRWPDVETTLTFRIDGLPAFYNSPRVLKPKMNGSAFWKALFVATTPVEPWLPNPPKQVETYGLEPLQTGVQKIYADHVPATTTSARNTRSVAPATAQIRNSVGTSLPNLKEFRRFHPEVSQTARAPNCPTAVPIDFHRMVAALGAYPELLKAVNLVIDAELDLTASELTSLRNKGKSKILANLTTVHAADKPDKWLTPWTLYAFWKFKDEWRFLPRHSADDTDHSSGLLRLGDTTKFNQSIVDIVGAVHQLAYVAPNQAQTALPRLRSSGIGVYRLQRGDKVRDRIEKAHAMESKVNAGAATQVELGWEHLARGYVVDVKTDGGPWRSLCERVGTYRVGQRDYFKDIADEGFISLAVADESNSIRVHESILTWDGFSLCVQRPSVDPTVASACGSTLALETVFKVAPGTLPTLRFGKQYRLRARIVDVAGNRLTLSRNTAVPVEPFFDESAMATSKLPYLRFDTPRAPTVHASEMIAPGPTAEPESNDVETMVLRSQSLQRIGKPAIYWLAPPAVPWTLWDEHGLLDQLKPNDRTDKVKAVLERSRRPWHQSLSNRTLPFFADPIVDRILVRGLPNPTPPHDGYVYLPVVGAFDKREALRIELKSGTAGGGPLYAVKGNTLSISLPPGYDEPLVISSCINPTFVDVLGWWGWLPQPVIASTKDAAIKGLNETLCPPRRIRLVHAIAQPQKPRLTGLSGIRQRGESLAKVDGACEIADPNTVGHLDVSASWIEAVDDLSQEGPAENQILVRVGRLGMKPAARSLPLAGLHHALPDTRYRGIAYSATAVSRFGEFFEKGSATSAESDRAIEIPIDATSPPQAPEPTFVVPTFRWESDTKWRKDQRTSKRSGYSVRVYLRRPWFTSGRGEMLAVLVARNPDDINHLKQPYLSQWGADPLYVDGPTGGANARTALRPDMFRGAAALTIKDLEIFPQGVPTEVQAALYPIAIDSNFSRERGQWYCDIELDVADYAVYMPFVRLALARFQPHAIRKRNDFDYRLSPVVVADIAQLQPNRTATIIRRNNTISLTVTGDMPPNAAQVLRADVIVQEREGNQVDIGWHDAATFQMKLEAGRIWTLNDAQIPSCGRRRLVIREYHRFPNASGAEGKSERISYLDMFDW